MPTKFAKKAHYDFSIQPLPDFGSGV